MLEAILRIIETCRLSVGQLAQRRIRDFASCIAVATVADAYQNRTAGLIWFRGVEAKCHETLRCLDGTIVGVSW